MAHFDGSQSCIRDKSPLKLPRQKKTKKNVFERTAALTDFVLCKIFFWFVRICQNNQLSFQNLSVRVGLKSVKVVDLIRQKEEHCLKADWTKFSRMLTLTSKTVGLPANTTVALSQKTIISTLFPLYNHQKKKNHNAHAFICCF